MQLQIGERLRAMELADEVEVRLSFPPPWTSDRITPEGREKLRLSGFAPPVLIGPSFDGAELQVLLGDGDLPVLRIAQHDPGQPVRADAVPRHLPLRRLQPALRAVQSHLVGFPIMAIDADEVRSDAQELLDAGAHDRLDTMRHSAAHIMAAAVLELFPEAKLGIGPAIRDGFYYDFDLPRALTPADLEAIEERMRAQVTGNLPFERSELDRAAALNQLENEGQDYKVEIVRELPDGEVISFYRHGAFNDLCRGPHLEATGGLGPFKLLNSAGAYWRGDEKRPMLQRIYGTVWESQEDLDRYLWRLEEAKKRDHRKLGRDLDLFTFHPESPAAPFWHPRGMAVWRALEQWSREVRRAGGFDEVRTPSLVRKELWETSGHWELYQDNMFVLDDHGHLSGLKPMNCPQEILIYKTRAHSYRELPIRFADYSVLFRKELTGALSGMFRVRQLVQDDSHVFCRDDQVIDEINLALDLVRRQFAPFGVTPSFKLATRPEKRLGSDEFWDMAEGKLKTALEQSGTPYAMDPGGAAFYAPKIDIFFEDALGREWQNATVQLDYQLPQRFDLEYRAADGGFERPAIIHYAIYGSFERFMAVITEHFAGAFPLWLAPVQVMVIPIADRHLEYAGHGARRAGGRRPARGDRRPLRTDAGQGARRPGAEGPGHARASATATRRRATCRGACGPGRPPQGRRAAGRLRRRSRRPRRASRAVALRGRGGRGCRSGRPPPAHEEDAGRRAAGLGIDRPTARGRVLRVRLRLQAPRGGRVAAWTWSCPASSSASAAPRSPIGKGCRSDSGSTPPARWMPGRRS